MQRMSNAAMVMPGPGEPLVEEQRPTEDPPPGRAVVRVRASSLNYHDLVNLMGLIKGPWPRVPMTDGAGEVVAVGDGVTSVAVGDRVFGAFHPDWLDGRLTRANRRATPGDTMDGWLQQHMTFPAAALTRTPAHLDDAEAASLVCAGTTAWNAIDTGGVRAGDVVVTQGTGGVSCFALQLAKARGATVVVTSSSDEKLEIARALGADHLVNRRADPAWERTVRELTDGEGADLVLDLGGQETLARSVAAARCDGHVAIIGVLSGHGDADFPVSDAMVRQVRLFGVSVGSVAMQRDLARAMTATGLHPHISHTFDWRELPAARELQHAQGHTGKIAISIP
jgi:NADPH:quinone reductase-like Zn-dependent oxidoreductase